MKAFHLQQIDSAAYTKGSSDLFLIERTFSIPISPSFSLRVRGDMNNLPQNCPPSQKNKIY